MHSGNITNRQAPTGYLQLQVKIGRKTMMVQTGQWPPMGVRVQTRARRYTQSPLDFAHI